MNEHHGHYIHHENKASAYIPIFEQQGLQPDPPLKGTPASQSKNNKNSCVAIREQPGIQHSFASQHNNKGTTGSPASL